MVQLISLHKEHFIGLKCLFAGCCLLDAFMIGQIIYYTPSIYKDESVQASRHVSQRDTHDHTPLLVASSDDDDDQLVA